MRTVFGDTLYWVALINPRDQWSGIVSAVSRALGLVQIFTTEEILVEVLASLAGAGAGVRRLAVQFVRDLRADPSVEIVPQTPQSFEAGLALYERRLDKSYSLTDGISMQTMRTRGITEVLTHDHHFAQEGFILLLRDGA
jgi:predicted nucleic acid-binding protein